MLTPQCILGAVYLELEAVGCGRFITDGQVWANIEVADQCAPR